MGLVWLWFFGDYLLNTFRYSTPEWFTFWLGLAIFGGFLFGFIYLISTEKLWKMILAFCYFLVVSIGMFMIARVLPESYVASGNAELVLGGYYLLSLSPIYLYYRYRKSRNAQKPKEL